MSESLVKYSPARFGKLVMSFVLLTTLVLPFNPESASATMTAYSCGIEAGTPSTLGGGFVIGRGDAWCGNRGELVSGSMTCLRRHRNWSFDWQGACKPYTVNSWNQRFVSSNSERVSGTQRYRTRQYGRFRDLTCACPTFTTYDESSWHDF